jgi:hypothetical protein
MPAKNVAFEQIKKFMGWCPNARVSETRQHISFENLESSVPERAGGENGDLKNPGWFRKLSNRILLIETFFTLAYILIINQLGINPIFLLIGFLIALLVIIFDWKAQMQRYNALVKQPVVDRSDKKILHFILYASVYITLYYFNIKGWESALQAMVSFIGGSLPITWREYFQLLYWEKKNHKIVFFDKSYGIWKKSYLLREKK